MPTTASNEIVTLVYRGKFLRFNEVVSSCTLVNHKQRQLIGAECWVLVIFSSNLNKCPKLLCKTKGVFVGESALMSM